MSHKGRFQKLGKSSKRMYGPRKLLVCGYSEEEQTSFLHFLESTSLSGIPVLFARTQDLEKYLQDILGGEHTTGLKERSDMLRAVIMSGLHESELQNLMQSYRKAELPGQLWASLTPFSEKWTLKELLKELEAESKAMKRQRKG